MSILRLSEQDDVNRAIKKCNDGDTVLLAPGIYSSIDFQGKEITLSGSNPLTRKMVENTVVREEGWRAAINLREGTNKKALICGLTITSGTGGVLKTLGNSATFKNCIITQCNEARLSVIQGSIAGDIKLINCIVADNHVNMRNVSLISWCRSLTMYNTFIFNNWTNLIVGSYKKVLIRNCSFLNNQLFFEAIENYDAELTITNSIFWKSGQSGMQIEFHPIHGPNRININYCNIEGGISSRLYEGIGNIHANPCFVDLERGDYRLRADSPCRGTGENGEDMGAKIWESDE